MKFTGVTRPVDKMGRVVIPREIRAKLNIENDIDKVEIYVEDNKIILQKYQPTCIFCDSLMHNVSFGDYTVCKSCIEKLYAIKDSED